MEHPLMTQGDPIRTNKPAKTLFKKPVSWAHFQVIKIQVYILPICTKTNFSATAYPILNLWEWVNHLWPQGTSSEPKKYPKVPPKNDLFPELVFRWLTSSCIFSKSANKIIFWRLPTPSPTPGGGSPFPDPKGPHQNLKATKNTSKKRRDRFFVATVMD